MCKSRVRVVAPTNDDGLRILLGDTGRRSCQTKLWRWFCFLEAPKINSLPVGISSPFKWRILLTCLVEQKFRILSPCRRPFSLALLFFVVITSIRGRSHPFFIFEPIFFCFFNSSQFDIQSYNPPITP